MTMFIFVGDMVVMLFMIVLVVWVFMVSPDSEIEKAAMIPFNDEDFGTDAPIGNDSEKEAGVSHG
jgi:hypothetical protein